MKKSAGKDAMISARVETAVKEAAERAAAGERRSVASLIEVALVEYLSARGYYPPAGGAGMAKTKGKGQ